MATALRHFADCVDLSEAQGLPRIAGPNRVMMGHCQIYTCAIDDASAVCAKGSKLQAGSATAPHKCSPLSRSVSA
jgi:hypothetical protein